MGGESGRGMLKAKCRDGGGRLQNPGEGWEDDMEQIGAAGLLAALSVSLKRLQIHAGVTPDEGNEF